MTSYRTPAKLRNSNKHRVLRINRVYTEQSIKYVCMCKMSLSVNDWLQRTRVTHMNGISILLLFSRNKRPTRKGEGNKTDSRFYGRPADRICVYMCMYK